jgi:hypothetical protein
VTTTVTTAVRQIAAVTVNSLAVLSDGGLLLWGSDSTGVVGEGIPSGAGIPVPTRAALTGVVKASVNDPGTSGRSVALAIVHTVSTSTPNVVGDFKAPAVSKPQALGPRHRCHDGRRRPLLRRRRPGGRAEPVRGFSAVAFSAAGASGMRLTLPDRSV